MGAAVLVTPLGLGGSGTGLRPVASLGLVWG